MSITDVLPYVASGLVSGIVAFIASWATMRVDLGYLRRDVDSIKRRLDGEDNPQSLMAQLGKLEIRITRLEAISGRRRTDAEPR